MGDLLSQNWSGPALQFCPACLSEGVPYFRRVWRMAFYRVCEVSVTTLFGSSSFLVQAEARKG